MRLEPASACQIIGTLVLLAFSHAAIAQTQNQPKANPGRQQVQATPAQAPQAQVQPVWGVTCGAAPGGLDCRALQTLAMTDSGRLSLAVRILPDTKKPVMLLLLPLGIYLPAGVTLQFGQDAAKMAPLQNCDSAGCLAEYPISEAEIAALVKGQGLTVAVQDASKQPISVQVPAAGFSAAYAKIK